MLLIMYLKGHFALFGDDRFIDQLSLKRNVNVLFSDVFITAINCGETILEATITLALGGASHQ